MPCTLLRASVSLCLVASSQSQSTSAPLSTCSVFSGNDTMCGPCTVHTSLLGDCFWCSEDNSCHDYGSVEFPASCKKSGCASHSTGTTCTGTCKPQTIPNFNVPLAQCLLGLSNASYYDGTTLDDTLEALGLSDNEYKVLSYKGLDTQGLLVAHPGANSLTLAFRGTQLNVKNGALDIDCLLDSYQKAVTPNQPSKTASWKVADGFSKAYHSLQSQLQAAWPWALAQVGSKPKLYITGHSLGGAMATIATSDLLLGNMTSSFGDIEVVTFAAPRAGNPSFAEGVGAMQKSWWAIQNFFDQIPHLPTQSMGYEHVESILIVGPNGGNIVQVTPQTDDEHFDITKNPIFFHKLSQYDAQVKALQGAAPGPTKCTDFVLTTGFESGAGNPTE